MINITSVCLEPLVRVRFFICEGGHVMIRYISLGLIAFSALCIVGAAWLGISNASGEASAAVLSTLNMFAHIATTCLLLAIAMGIWLKD